MSDHQQDAELPQPANEPQSPPCRVLLFTYGKKFGQPNKRDWDGVFNCTAIPNPPASTRKGTTGLSKRFRAEILGSNASVAQDILQRAAAQIADDTMQALCNDNDDGETSNHTSINGTTKRYAFFCEHGKHRSVTIAETLAAILRTERKLIVEVQHRDVERKAKSNLQDRQERQRKIGGASYIVDK